MRTIINSNDKYFLNKSISILTVFNDSLYPNLLSFIHYIGIPKTLTHPVSKPYINKCYS